MLFAIHAGPRILWIILLSPERQDDHIRMRLLIPIILVAFQAWRHDLSFGTRFGTIYLNNQKWKFWMAIGCLLLFAIAHWIAHPMDHPTVPRTVE